MAERIQQCTQVLRLMGTYRAESSANNPHLEDIAEAMSLWWHAAIEAESWERESGGGPTAAEKGIFDHSIEEMQKGRFFNPEADEFQQGGGNN